MDFTYLDNLSSAYTESRILHAAVDLNIFDAIGDKRASAQEVSLKLHTDERATLLFLNALTALNLLRKEENLFSLTELARKYLLSTSETCYTGMVRFESAMWSVWGDLARAIRTGKPVRVPDRYQTDREETESFIMAMHHLVSARGDAGYIAARLCSEGGRSLLDIGSGPGTYPIAIFKKDPDMGITIFDLPGTLEVTRRVLSREGIDRQIQLTAGDYNKDTLPGGFDVVFLSNIIHGEDEEANRALMKKIYHSVNPGGRIIIKDHILNEDLTRPACGAIFSIYMLLTTKGRDYGYHEVRRWLEEAGFVDIALEELPPPMTSSLACGRRGA